MLSRFRHIYAVLFFLILASCSAGGCSGCSGCGGTALPGGFPTDRAIDNAASVRVSRPGLDFLETSLPTIVSKASGAPGGKLTIDVPQSTIPTQNLYTLNYGLGTTSVTLDGTICPGGPDPKAVPPKCVAEVDIGSATFQLDSVKPDLLTLTANIPLMLEDTPIQAVVHPGPLPDVSLTIHVGFGANGTCVGNPASQASVQPKVLPIKVSIPLVAETLAPRTGYTKIDVDNAVVDLGAINGGDVQICADCGPLDFTIFGFHVNVCNSVLNLGFIKNTLVSQLTGGLGSQVKSLLKNQLCTKPNPALNPSCPFNTHANPGNSQCVYDSSPSTCVPMLLGTDSHIDLSSALKSISPGTTGGLDFGLASFGAMKPFPNANANGSGRTTNGITLGMIGGVLPQPPSKCVPQADLKLPTGIPIPDELAPTANEPAGTPHVGIALAGRFLDFSMGSLYNSGLLCLGISTEQVDMLKSGLLSLLIPSIKNLTFEQGDAAAAIATRPQAPPTIKLGGGTNIATDPLLAISLPKFAIDFYIWSYDRFVRAFTFEADLTIPVNLQTGKDPVKNPNGGLLPVLGDIKVANGTVTNADLLMDDPVLIAGALQGLLGGISKQLVGGGFKPVDLSSALASTGLGLQVDHIGKLTKNQDDFLAIFANLAKAPGAATVEADTTAQLLSKTVPADHMQLGTMTPDALPELVVLAGSPLDDGKRVIEYSWRIDEGTPAAWTTDKRLSIKDDQLLLQGRHTLHVVARVAGQAMTEDLTPADVPFVIDAVAPFVKVSHEGKTAKVEAWDLVSQKDTLVARFRVDGAELGAWKPLAELATIDVGAAGAIDVEVKDEEGNVRQVHQELIRGRADSSLSAAGSGCGCSMPGKTGGSENGKLALVVALAGLAFVALRRSAGFGHARHALLAIGAIGAVAATSQGCACGSSADGNTGCGSDCNQACKTALDQGLPGSYTSVAKAKDGSIWIAGYNDALLQDGDSTLFGDLVVGKYDLGKQKVDWKTVDGLPVRTDGTCADRSSDSWRNGESDSGDDVGLWTSIQVSTEDHPIVTYYDATNHRLKFAYEDNGWHSFVLKELPGADIGRYSKMIIVGDRPTIAYLHIEAGNGGKTRSKVVVARAHVPTPRGADAFDFEDAAVEEDNPCRVATCPNGTQCLKTQGICAPVAGGCTPADCGTGNACVTLDNKATCAATANPIETYPNVFGDYVSLQQGPAGLGIALYDRVHGNLVGLADRGGGHWDRFIIDGETGSRADNTAIDTGDVGIGASLVIDAASQWHVSYVNGLDESVRYITVQNGKAGKSEVVDDGTSVDGKAFTDGQHVVGDDSTVHADGDIVTVYYQDATAGMLRRASGTPNGPTHKWDLRALAQPGKFGGFFPQIIPGDNTVANWWRQTDAANKTVVGDVTILTP